MRTLIPLNIYDGFFTNPDSIREYALSLDYSIKGEKWPGHRTDYLHKIDERFFNLVNNRILSLFLSETENFKLHYQAGTHFQKITDSQTEGWVHADNGELLTAIVYLTPNPAANTGTSIYKLKTGVPYRDVSGIEIKQRFNKKGDNADQEKKAREENNSIFEETVNISNVYNRLVVFDSTQFHAAQCLGSAEQKYERLTLISFFNDLPINLPYLKMRCDL